MTIKVRNKSYGQDLLVVKATFLGEKEKRIIERMTRKSDRQVLLQCICNERLELLEA